LPTTGKSLIDWGKEALLAEAKAIEAAASRLGDGFAAACEIILQCEGKIATTGIGKSGHIARKISSTFASTGTPSYYLHPSEALHGDFGMLDKRDCLLAIAYGGETPEVIEVANFARRLGARIIGVTGKPDSALARVAHVAIDAAVSQEACPLNLAPTSSSTLALAIGDALAISVMCAKGFKQSDFASLHPKGSLGRRLALVRQSMRRLADLRTVGPEATFAAVLEAITKPNFGIIAVVGEQAELLGAITDGDIRRGLVQFGNELIHKNARDLMMAKPKTIVETDFAVDAVQKMEAAKITSLFVVDPQNPKTLLGMVRMHDLIEAKIV